MNKIVINTDELKNEYKNMDASQIINLINNYKHIETERLKPEFRLDENQLLYIVNECKHLELSNLKPEVRNMSTKYLTDFLNSATEQTSLLKATNWSTTKVISSTKGLLTEKALRLSLKGFECKKINACAGDLVIQKTQRPDIVIMLEFKNYSNTVPHEEIEKFYRDIELHQFSGGIFISNQPISDQNQNNAQFTIKQNIAFVYTHEPDVINLICEMMWIRIMEKKDYIMIGDKSSILQNVDKLNSNIERLAVLKHANEKNYKSAQKHYEVCNQELSSLIYDTKDIIYEITKNVCVFTTTISSNDAKLPDNAEYFTNTYPRAKKEFEMILEKIKGNGNIVITQNKHKFEYCVNSIKIQFEFAKTKMHVYFAPKNISLSEMDPRMNFTHGLMHAEITKQNVESDIYSAIFNMMAL